MLISFGLTSNQVYAPSHIEGGTFSTCAECSADLQQCLDFVTNPDQEQQCREDFQECILFTFEGSCFVAGSLTPIDSTMVLAAGVQSISAWMIPIIVSGIGIAIVIARKF